MHSARTIVRIAIFLEPLIVFLIALLALYGFLHLYRTPNLALIFDGAGYLATTREFMATLEAQDAGSLITQLWLFVAGGFSESARTELAGTLSGVRGITWSGPLLPVLLSFSYWLSGKSAESIHWAVGTWAMWFCQAGTVLAIWACAALAFNRWVARAATLLALTYAPFAINSLRLSTETPATLLICLSIFFTLYFWLGRSLLFRNFWLQRAFFLFSAVATGYVYALLSISRSQLIFLPCVLVIACLIVRTFRLVERQKAVSPFPGDHLTRSMPSWRRISIWSGGIFIGALICLLPWMFCNFVFTGRPSITVDRSSAYNLYCGLNTRTLGLDVLPSEFVVSPQKFKRSMSDVLKELLENAVHDPARLATMVLLKPSRLLDSPWNDFKVDFWRQQPEWQRFYHQSLLLLAIYGLLLLVNSSFSPKKDASELTVEQSSEMMPDSVLEPDTSDDVWSSRISLAVFTAVIFYQAINLIAISMTRYFYPAMPAIIIMAGYSLWRAYSCARARGLVLVFALASCTPSLILLLDLLQRPQSQILQRIVLKCGLEPVSISLALLVASVLSYSIYLFCRIFISKRNYPEESVMSFGTSFNRGKYALLASIFSLPFILYPLYYGYRQMEYYFDVSCASGSPLRISIAHSSHHSDNALVGNEKSRSENANSPADHKSNQQWYLIVDNLGAVSSGVPLPKPVISLNGRRLDSTMLMPMLAFDRGQRDSFGYLKSFAHSGRFDVSRLRQWFCLPVPAEYILTEEDNHVEIALPRGAKYEPTQKLYVSADFLDNHGKPLAPRDFSSFSWTLGFAVSPPYDMRMLSYPVDKEICKGESRPENSASINYLGATELVRPRVYLMQAEELDSHKSAVKPLSAMPLVRELEGGAIGEQGQPASLWKTLPEEDVERINESLKQIEDIETRGLFLRLTTSVASANRGAEAGLCLLSTLSSSSRGASVHIAPLSPEYLPIGNSEHKTMVLDLLPVDGPDGKLDQCSILATGASWWEALQYGRYKPDKPVRFAKMVLSVEPYRMQHLERCSKKFYQGTAMVP